GVKVALAAAIALTVLAVPGASSASANRVARSDRGSAVLAASLAGRTSQSFTVHGTTVTLQQLRARQEPPKGNPREASSRRATNIATRPASKPTATPSRISVSPHAPQTPVDEILGPQITDTAGYVPPDTMGAVGDTQFLFSVNGRFRAYNKTSPHTQIFDMAQTSFWGSTADVAGVSDGHVRYDGSTQRWFIT